MRDRRKRTEPNSIDELAPSVSWIGTTGRILTRRNLLKLGTGAFLTAALPAKTFTLGDGPYGNFDMGIQSDTFRHFPLPDMLQKVRDLGLRSIEGWTGHFPLTDDPQKIAGYKDALGKAKIKIPAYGVVDFGGDPAENRKYFVFAKALGVSTLTADPSPEAFASLDDLVKEFKIRVAIHNHGPGSRYSDAATLYKAIEKHDKRIGACIDTGYYIRSGQDPVKVADHLGKRVFGVHLKDMKVVDGLAEFTEVGLGILKIIELFKVLQKNDFDGVMALEDEEHEEDPTPSIKDSLSNVRAAVQNIRMQEYD